MKKIRNLVERFMNYMEASMNEVIKYNPAYPFTGQGFSVYSGR